jgi:hypothetical protein
MEQSTAARRLVKSPPELWAVLSSEVSLGRHLAEFGEIRITRVDPETTVAWEGDRASGTVELAPTGWGTKVILTATPSMVETAEAGGRVRPPALETAEAGGRARPPVLETAEACGRVRPPVLETAEVGGRVGPPAGQTAEVDVAVVEVAQPPAATSLPEPIAVRIAAPSQPDEPAPQQPRRQRRGLFAWLFRSRRRPNPWVLAGSTPTPAPAPKADPLPRAAAGSLPGPPPPMPGPSPPTPTPSPGPPQPGQDPTPPDPGPVPTPGPPPLPDPVPPTPPPQPPAPPSIQARPGALAGAGPRRRAMAAPLDHARTVAILTDVLDDLGADHHRPYRRD